MLGMVEDLLILFFVVRVHIVFKHIRLILATVATINLKCADC